ncbi:MAG: hypothetical protein AN484_02645 [Aphanizomenon flos-aquae WA102]|jgi:hypothetical protein|uniref:DUF1643 domain-containing protein n=1 Tax=Aphanizomenon flos-aquae WA102 TaxID=1710896 RepID=A0A1B7X794_APHFL|nr:MAG: hypothetical protein AN484_02645 [Aphanizomenon flos-aquae WA102]
MEIKGYAEIDFTKKYRYLLGRKWDENLPQVTFIMLNPSTADDKKLDYTLIRCIDFAQSWKKYGSLELVNLFAYRATYPTELGEVDDPVGPDNDHYIKLATQRADLIVLAWGVGANKHTRIKNRDKEVLSLISGQQPIYCLQLTKEGHPHHPIGLTKNLQPVIFPYQQS